LAEDGNDRFNTEEKLQSVLESPIKDTKLPLGADVTVSRVSVADFDDVQATSITTVLTTPFVTIQKGHTPVPAKKAIMICQAQTLYQAESVQLLQRNAICATRMVNVCQMRLKWSDANVDLGLLVEIAKLI